MTEPLVSCVMTFYNGQRYFAQAVRSLLDQTYSNLELILVDDGSSDGTTELAREFERTDSRVHLIVQANAGIASASNTGLEQCRGQYIARMDSDDVSLPDRLQRQVQYMEQHGDVVCLGGDIQMIDGRGRYLTTLTIPRTHDEIDDKHLRGHCSIWHTIAMMRHDAIKKIGGYDVQFGSSVDIELYLRLAEVGRLANLPQALGQYRLHEGGISQNKQRQQNEACQRAVEITCQRRQVESCFEEKVDWRPGADRDSRYRFDIKYGWWAFNSGEQKTAMIYGLKAMSRRPWGTKAWKLFGCAMLKCPKKAARS